MLDLAELRAGSGGGNTFNADCPTCRTQLPSVNGEATDQRPEQRVLCPYMPKERDKRTGTLNRERNEQWHS